MPMSTRAAKWASLPSPHTLLPPSNDVIEGGDGVKGRRGDNLKEKKKKSCLWIQLRRFIKQYYPWWLNYLVLLIPDHLLGNKKDIFSLEKIRYSKFERSERTKETERERAQEWEREWECKSMSEKGSEHKRKRAHNRKWEWAQARVHVTVRERESKWSRKWVCKNEQDTDWEHVQETTWKRERAWESVRETGSTHVRKRKCNTVQQVWQE